MVWRWHAYPAGRGGRLCHRNNSARRTAGVQPRTPSAPSCPGPSPLWSGMPHTAPPLEHTRSMLKHTMAKDRRGPVHSLLTRLLTPDHVDDISVFPTAGVLWSKAGADQLSAATYCSDTNSRRWTESQEQQVGVNAAHVRTWGSVHPS